MRGYITKLNFSVEYGNYGRNQNNLRCHEVGKEGRMKTHKKTEFLTEICMFCSSDVKEENIVFIIL